ncbi:sigma 54-interacting transcriptional regulator [Oryzomonas rubra]|uniref:AAA family ATPase n=1 Tax=Oryzomonas rubra TaxID=2509454 RepID=A0A5A9XBZ3_9BACT|nr:sigma 54-interacting transcriptional regulator [Oryzomonas rubra]KAA0889779.1 AAA family ATPase [Oryzomonas rubra]
MVDRNVFFRDVTTKVCSSIHIDLAVNNTFEYLRRHIPLDAFKLATRDENRRAIRCIAQASADKREYYDKLIPIPADLWPIVKSRNFSEPILMNTDEIYRKIAPLAKHEESSTLMVPLATKEVTMLGALTFFAHGRKRYDAAHIELLATIARPFSMALANALARENLSHNRSSLRDDNCSLPFFQEREEIVGGDSGLRNVMEMARRVAPLNSTVLITGETGTGKELIANAIHSSSSRKAGPFIKVNCGAIPENLIDSELFGHEKGAFTGAVAEKHGKFEQANGGTIFLDEIGEMALQSQVRLLRVLQSRKVCRVGGDKLIDVDVRVITATNCDLEQMVSQHRFREDLWFRLNVFPINVPPLRQRKEDIPTLIRHFIMMKSRELGIVTPPAIAPGTIGRLVNYHWPGNVRELENLVERELICRWGEQLRFDSMSAEHACKATPTREWQPADGPLNLDEVMSMHISKVLKMTKGKIFGPHGAAELLGINYNTLRGRMRKLGLMQVKQEA